MLGDCPPCPCWRRSGGTGVGTARLLPVGFAGCCCTGNANPDPGWAGGSAFPSTSRDSCCSYGNGHIHLHILPVNHRDIQSNCLRRGWFPSCQRGSAPHLAPAAAPSHGASPLRHPFPAAPGQGQSPRARIPSPPSLLSCEPRGRRRAVPKPRWARLAVGASRDPLWLLLFGPGVPLPPAPWHF